MRRSGPLEARLICDILPRVLVDFFPPADVVNRVVTEFMSPGQPHQVLLSGVLFSVFRQAAAAAGASGGRDDGGQQAAMLQVCAAQLLEMVLVSFQFRKVHIWSLCTLSTNTEKCIFMDQEEREISRFFVAPPREFAPAV